MASALFSSIQSLSTKLLQAIRGTTSTSPLQQDPASPDTDQNNSVRKDLEKLSRMLARIQAVQQDAEEREIHDRSVRLWLAELRGLAYQAEDVLDEFYYEVLRSIVESGDAAIEAYHRNEGNKREVVEQYPSSALAPCSSYIIKISIPNGMAEKIKCITERFEEISNDRHALQLREEDGTRLVIGPQIRPPTSSHVDERAIFGRTEEKEKIISLLNPLNHPEFMVLPIIGMGGLGKTTLAQLVYNDSKFLQLFDKRAWVSVFEDFDLVRLTRAIIESINRTTCEFSELSILQDILKEKISHVSLFLVLDDVWNENTELWEQFQVALKGGKPVKILTTTRNTSVAEIMQTTSPFQLDCLPNEKCWSLFKHFAFDNGEASENGKLLEIGYGIVKKCKGSPLVTKVLGGILRYDMDEEKWREILKSDISEIDENGKILTPLQLSYQKLPLHLKPCFVYLAMFPKGKVIEKDHVVRLWMAQGYINSNSSRTKKTLEEIGSEYLNELHGRSLIDFGYYNKCFVHDLIHDLARSICQKINQPVLENDNLWNSSYKINHLYLTGEHELSDSLASCNNKVIRTYVRECPRSYIDDTAIFPKITYVRALKLGNCMLPDTLNTLKHLRYLSIEDYKIESLPESLCLLYHLQTLDVNCRNILELPENIRSLINLRFLRLCSGKIKQLPESISLLHNLDTLSIEFCGKLEKLPRSIEQHSSPSLKSISLSGLPNLSMLPAIPRKVEMLGINTCGCQEIKFSSPSELKKLSISNCRELITIYYESGDLPFLESISLSECPNLSMLSAIPQKVEVLAVNACGCQEMMFSSPSKLKKLSISNCRELIAIYYKSGDLPFLKSISLSGLPNLSMLSAIPQKVEVLEVSACGCQEIKFSSSSELNKLSISNCRELIAIYYKSGDLPFLESISLSGLANLSMLSAIPQKVEVLEVNACGCQEIKFSSTSKLKKLSISNSRELITIYFESGDLPFLESISLFGLAKMLMPSPIPQKVEVLEVNACGCHEIKFSSPSELKKLSISNCIELITIYYECGDLPFLESISLSACPNLSMLLAIPQKVEVLEVNACGCEEIKFCSPSELKKLSIFDCRELVTIYYKSGDLPFLKSISLFGCPNLSMLLAIPQKVKVLDVENCGFQEISFSSQSKLQKISIFNCTELVSIYYKIGDLPFLESISLSGCPKLLIFSAILEEMKQMDKRNSGFQSEIQNVSISNNREFIPPFLRRVSLSDCPKLSIFSAIPDVELDTMEIINCGIREIILPSRCKLLVIHNCPELISVHWRDGDSSSLPLVKFVDCLQLKLLKIPKEVEVLKIKSCGTHEIFFSSQSKVQSVRIYDCPELFSVHWMDWNVSFLKELFFEGCPELISLQFLQGDLPLLEKFTIKSCLQFHEVLTIPYQLKELKIVDCCFPEIHLSPQSKLQRLIIRECANLTAIKGLQVQFPTGDVSHPMMEMVDIRNCPRINFGTQGNSYFYQVMQEASQDLGTEPWFSYEEDGTQGNSYFYGQGKDLQLNTTHTHRVTI